MGVGSVFVMACLWRSEYNFVELILSFHLGFGNQTQWSDYMVSAFYLLLVITFDFLKQFVFYVWLFCLDVCLCTDCMQCPRGSEEESHPLELELQTVLSHCMGAGSSFPHILQGLLANVSVQILRLRKVSLAALCRMAASPLALSSSG